MRIDATHPGRNGDILWALPTVRAIAAAYGELVHLTIPAQYGSLAPLLAQQAYIGSVLAREDWQVEQTAPITPRVPPQWQTSARADRMFHLGYAGWPRPTLPEDVYERMCDVSLGGRVVGDPALPSLDLTTPWITVPATADARYPHVYPQYRLGIGFTDEHFELKYGLLRLVNKALPHLQTDVDFLCTGPGRWMSEANHPLTEWTEAALALSRSRVFFGCCSALHVLAVGLGVPAVVMEPNPHRLHPVFWPCGQDGPQVRLVKGTDGQATWDARHCAEVLREVLNG